MLTRKLLSRSNKLRLYNKIIKLIVIFACKTRIIKRQIEGKLLIYERKLLRAIFCKQADQSWRINTNEELDKLTKRENIVREIK